MEFKALDFKKYNHIKYTEIEEKYRNDYTTNPVKFSEDEFKSILALLFSIRYHLPEISEQQRTKINDIIYESYPIINITSKFGRQLIENLESEYLDWFNSLLNKSYLLSKVFIDKELKDFVHVALIDYLIIRKIEYGKFFLNEWSKTIIDTKGYFFNTHSNRIKNSLDGNTDSLKIISSKIQAANPKLPIDEGLLLVFTLKEYFIKSNNAEIEYAITNYIVRDKIHDLNLRSTIYKSTINEVINQKWNLNKGKGGQSR